MSRPTISRITPITTKPFFMKSPIVLEWNRVDCIKVFAKSHLYDLEKERDDFLELLKKKMNNVYEVVKT